MRSMGSSGIVKVVIMEYIQSKLWLHMSKYNEKNNSLIHNSERIVCNELIQLQGLL